MATPSTTSAKAEEIGFVALTEWWLGFLPFLVTILKIRPKIALNFFSY